MRRPVTVMATAVLIAGVALGAAACGDDDGDGSEVGALSRSEFADQANQLCRDHDAGRRSILEGIDPDAAAPEQAESIDEVIDVDEKLLADVDDLVPPESEQDTVDQLLDEWRQRIEISKQLREAVATDDSTDLESLSAQVRQVDAEANQIAAGLGLDDCTRGDSA